MESSDATSESQPGREGDSAASQLPEIRGDAASSQSMRHCQPKAAPSGGLKIP